MLRKSVLPKWFIAFGAGLCLFLFSAVPLNANGPAPGPSILVRFEGKPSGVAFVDLLVPIDDASNDYQPYNREYGEAYSIQADSPIVTYDGDGYRSYTFHFVGASPGMELDGPYGYGNYYDVRFETGMEDLKGTVDFLKVALLDAQGNILHVTEPVRIAGSLTGFFTGFVEINGNSFEITGDGQYTSPLMVIFFFFSKVAFSVLVEVVIAYFFKITPLWRVAVMNIATQAALTIFMLAAPLSYWMSVLVGEIAVYLVEGVAMMLMYKNVGKKRLIAYVFIANTASLSLGVLLNYLVV